MTRPAAPVAPRESTVHRAHGLERPDDYHWLKTDGRGGERVLAYLEAENRHLSGVLAPHEELVRELAAELRSHLQEDDEQPPVQEGGWLYFSRTETGRDHPLYLRRPVSGGAEELLLDLNALRDAEGLQNVWLSGARPSPDGRFWAYLLDTTGQEHFELRVLDTQKGLDTQAGKLHETPLPGVSGWTLCWGADSRTVYYVTDDETQRPYRVWRHRLGTPQTTDDLLYQEDDPTFRVAVTVGASGDALLLHCDSTLTSEWHTLDAHDPAARPQVVVPRSRGTEYVLEDGGDHWLALTNAQAPEFRLVRLPRRENVGWTDAQDVLPHDPSRYLTGLRPFAHHLLLSGREGGYTQLWVLDRLPEGGYGPARRTELPEESHTVRAGGNRVYDTATARVLYTSLIRPLEHLDLDLQTLQTTLVRATPVPGYDPELYLTEQHRVTAPDGEQVPVSLIRRRDTALPAPTLLYGYGSYGFSNDPVFSARRLPLLDRGWVWAVAHIRGGSELGRRWYEAGRLQHKMNTFTDFIAAAEGLTAQGVSRAGELVAEGRSAGGLLMGAVLNLRPELFRAALVGVPFLDVLSTMLDASIPLTTGEYDEWGNPEQREWYGVMAAYSPYDNLKAGAYPHLFVSGGLNDPRVAYWEPAKYVARLRTLALQGSGEVVLKTNMGAGHGGSSGRYDALREVAEEYAFLLAVARVGTGDDTEQS